MPTELLGHISVKKNGLCCAPSKNCATQTVRRESSAAIRGWDGGIRTHDIRVKVWCVTITLHPNIGAKTTGIGITPNPRFRGVGKGVRTLDTRNHNPVLSRLSYTHHRSEMVRQEGFEPPAYCLEGSCSIQLSYWRAYNILLPAQKVWSG